MVTILTPLTAIDVAAEADGNDLWLTAADLPRATGYELKPEGFCQDDLCVRVPAGRESAFVRDGAEGVAVNVANFWRYLDAAVVRDDRGATWSLGDPPSNHASRLDSLAAPEFTLPDVNGTLHSLSDYRGRKVLLAAWASW